jgi:alpha 1,2-mannosyltransferase
LTLIRLLRSYKCNLPVEVFHFPDEKLAGHEFAQLGVILRKVTGIEKQSGAWKNFQLKGRALVQSQFREILYLDSCVVMSLPASTHPNRAVASRISDNVPLRNPSHLFKHSSYVKGGRAVFWPDYNKDHRQSFSAFHPVVL